MKTFRLFFSFIIKKIELHTELSELEHFLKQHSHKMSNIQLILF